MTSMRWLVGLAVLALPMTTLAEVPSQMNVQGQLLNAEGQPVDGDYTITFTIYDGSGAGATAVWTETIDPVSAVGGLFDVVLGAGLTPLLPSVFTTNGPLWLGVAIDAGPGVADGGDPELPRRAFNTVAYAFSASWADSAGSADTATTATTATSATTAASADQSLDLDCTGCVSMGELDSAFVDSLVTEDELNTALAGLSTLGTLGCTEVGSMPMWDGLEWTCVVGGGGGSDPEDPCVGEQRAMQWDGDNWICVTLNQTGLAEGEAKGYELKDSWGFSWDGIERQSGTWASAKLDCESRGGRLPTATELYRVSGAHKSEIGDSYETNYLWSLTTWSEANKVRIRLTDGAVTNTAATSNAPYRCVWSNNPTTHFTGNHCYGEPGSECWTAVHNGKMSMDTMNRPAMSYMAAVWECNYYYGHLATLQDYTENIRQGLPNGTGTSGTWSWTSDHNSYRGAHIVRWTNNDTTFAAYGDNRQTWQTRGTSSYHFRCIGVNQAVGANPQEFADEFVGRSYLKARTTTTATGQYVAGSDICFEQGGHLIDASDLEQLVMEGMPNGPGTGGSDYIYTSESSDYRYVQIARWGGVDTTYTGYHSEHVTWSSPTNNYQHRCAFYPLDPDFEEPEVADCVGGCYSVEKGPADAKLKYYMDSFDRSPTVTWAQAMDACVAAGGRLPTAHQLTELIRSGLPNGFNLYLWTADGSNEGSNHPAVYRWNGVDTSFNATNSTYKTWQAATSAYGYRCLFTNELR